MAEPEEQKDLGEDSISKDSRHKPEFDSISCEKAENRESELFPEHSHFDLEPVKLDNISLSGFTAIEKKTEIESSCQKSNSLDDELSRISWSGNLEAYKVSGEIDSPDSAGWDMPGSGEYQAEVVKSENEEKLIDPRNSMTIFHFPSDVSIHDPFAVVLPGETLHDGHYETGSLEGLTAPVADIRYRDSPPESISSEYAALENDTGSSSSTVDPVTMLIRMQYEELKKKYQALTIVDPLVGKCLAERYLVEAVVGTGAMAIVYKGQDMDTGKPVAIKTHRAGDDVMRRRFEMEIATHSKLSHRNIVQFIEAVSNERNRRFLVMENVRGISISESLELQGRFRQPENIWLIIEQVSCGLEHAHGRGIVHRDLKSGNVILAQEEDGSVTAKLFDFGLSRDNRNSNRLTQVGRALGSPLYMSPEQCQGKDVSVLSDVYSLGVLAFEVITGRFPFVGSTIPEIMKAHCDPGCRPVSLRFHVPDIPAPQQLEAILNKALAIDPYERFLSVSRFMKAFAFWIESVRADRLEQDLPVEYLR